MGDKRTQYFLKLTECNIQGVDLPTDKNRTSVLSTKIQHLLRLTLISMLIIGISVFLWQIKPDRVILPWFNLQPNWLKQLNLGQDHLSEVSVVKIKPTIVSPTKLQVYLKSEIPPFHLAAERQALEIVPLQRAELMIDATGDDFSKTSMVAMDKVVVLPKMMLSHLRQVA